MQSMSCNAARSLPGTHLVCLGCAVFRRRREQLAAAGPYRVAPLAERTHAPRDAADQLLVPRAQLGQHGRRPPAANESQMSSTDVADTSRVL